MNQKNSVSGTKTQPVKRTPRLAWALNLLTPLVTVALLHFLAPEMTIDQQILVILAGLFVLLGIQLYRVHKTHKQESGLSQ